MIVLDTNIVSELQNKSPAPAVLRWLQSVDLIETFICGPVLMEQAYGAERFFVRSGSVRYRETLSRLRTEFAERKLPMAVALLNWRGVCVHNASVAEDLSASAIP
jgi:predicted nucleic acid-binding protein